MKKKLMGLLGLFVALGSLAATPEQIAAAQKELLAEVKAIDVGGGALPGGFILIGEDVFPLAECRNYDGTTAFAAVGGFYGAGRAMFLAHPNYLLSTDFKYDTKRLIQNAVRWEAKGKEKPRVAVLRNGAVAKFMQAVGCADVTTIPDLSTVGAYDVLVAIECRRNEVEAMLSYVKGGGGLIEGALGWGFMYFNKNACFAEDFVDNRVTGTIGALMGDTGVTRINDQGFPAVAIGGNATRGVNAYEAIDLAVKGEITDKKLRTQVAKTLLSLMNALPSGVHPEVYARLADIAKRPGADVLPTPQRPLGDESMFARLAIIARKNAYLAEPEKVWPADPCAATYPGLVKPGTPSITRTVPVDLSIPRWHSTGVFAPAGQALTVTLPEAATKLGLKVRIGTTADDLSASAEWKRFPLVTMELPLTKRETTFSSPFGGLVYVVVPDQRLTGVQEVTLAGGVMAPWFKRGRDTNAKFAEECRTSGAPQGEIEGDDFIITSETAGLRRVDDPAWIAEFWDKVMKADMELAQWKTRRSPERTCADVQLTAGWLHNGYPLMSHVNDDHFDWAIDKAGLESGDGWGVYHEIGHNHQSHAWTPDGTGEVTVNLFTMYALETVAGANVRDGRYPCGTQQARRRVRNWVKRGKKFQDWKNDYFLALEMYLRIKEAYGWDAYKKTFARYLEPGFKQPQNDAEKWSIFARELSKTVNADMGAVLAAWSIPLDEATRKACAAYPAAKSSLTAELTPRKYVPPATKPVQGEYMAVTLSGEEAGTITMIPTRAEIPGGEQDRRWKTTHLLLRRIEPTTAPVTLGRLNAPTNAFEAPHPVEITKPYYIGVYEFTQEQYFRVMGSWRKNCWGAAGDRETRPVNGISYDEVRGGMNEGIDWPTTGHQVSSDSVLGRLRRLIGYRAEFDLPTEAQWEYAGRAGTTGDWNNGEEGKPYTDETTKFARNTNLDKLGRYSGNGGESGKKDDPLMKSGVKTPYGTAEVGSYAPNAWGLYDFHGNVYEHCLDYLRAYHEALADYSGKDPVGPKDCGVNREGRRNDARRAMRGGTYWNFSFGSPGACVIWSRGLGGWCGTGTGHGATGFRLAVPAAVAPEASQSPDAEPLGPAALRARAALVRGVETIDSKGLPGPVYCTSSNAFPVIAAKNWDGSPACVAAASFVGAGRVVVLADDALDETLAGNARFLKNVTAWLSDGPRRLGLFRRTPLVVDLAKLPAEERALAARIDEVEKKVRDGAGCLLYGRAWPWRQRQMAETGRCRVADWPGNRLLARFGLLVGDFCVRRTAESRGWLCLEQCQEGAALAPSEIFSLRRAQKSSEPVVRPLKERGCEGILVRDGETVAFLGDSITRLGANPSGYINLVLKGLEVAGVKDVGKVPAGIDGQHSGDMLGRIGGLLANPEVRVMTISCGVNDVWGFDWGRGVQLEEYARSVRRMYDKAAAAGVQVVAMTPTLMREEPDNEYNRLLDTFADFIRAEARLRNLPLADCRAAELAALKAFPPDSGNHFTYDGVHPVWEGNKLIAREVLRAMGVPEKYSARIEEAWREIGGR